jgi:hypothetical protein
MVQTASQTQPDYTLSGLHYRNAGTADHHNHVKFANRKPDSLAERAGSHSQQTQSSIPPLVTPNCHAAIYGTILERSKLRLAPQDRINSAIARFSRS